MNIMEKVSSKDYLDWLINAVEKSENGIIDEESIYYNGDKDEYENYGKYLSSFQRNLEKLAEEQNVPAFRMDVDFPEEGYYFFVNGNYYLISTMFGQGSITSVEKVLETPPHAIVFGEYEPNPDKELVQYIIVNKDIKMSTGKISAQVAHVVTICTVKELNNPRFQMWYKGEQKKVILEAHLKDLEKLEAQGCYAIRDNGHTEIPANTLTAVSMGIKTREEMKPLVKRFQTLKDRNNE